MLCVFMEIIFGSFWSLCVGLPDLQKVVVIPYARSKHETDLSKIPNRCVSADTATLNCTEMLKLRSCITESRSE